MTESPSIDLASLFKAAAQVISEHKEDINALDGYNGNHGDNTLQNVQMVMDTLTEHQADPPDQALRLAGAKLSENGHGGTSQYYSRGLLQAADKLSGKTDLKASDGISLIQSLLGALPAQGYPKPEESTPSVLDLFAGMAGGGAQAQPAQVQQPQAQPGQMGGLLDLLTGLAGAQGPSAPQAQPQPGQMGDLVSLLTGLTGAQGAQAHPAQPVPQAQDGPDMGDVLGKLLPAGLAYLQAKQAGADPSQAAQAALLATIMGTKPQQAQTPRQGAGAALAQGMLQAILGRR